MIYLDHNATTPVDPRVVEAMVPFFHEHFGNPSSVHRAGRNARAALDRAREQVAALVGAQPSQVIFTSGGTEANNLALSGVATGCATGQLLLSPVEHPSVLEPARRRVAAGGWTLDWLPVDRNGRVDVAAYRPVVNGTTQFVSLMWANNETGTLQPVTELAACARASGAIVHSDAVQAAGKLPLDFAASGVHLMTLSSHKIYGPKGIGALIVDKSLDLAPLQIGGGQERGLRSGTENLSGIVGFGVAAELLHAELEPRRAASTRLRERLDAGLRGLPGVTLFATGAERLPNTTMFALAGYDGEALLMLLDQSGIAISSGSACHSGSGAPSHVLTAMGVPDELARGAVRVSFGQANGDADVDALIGELGRLARTGSTWAATA